MASVENVAKLKQLLGIGDDAQDIQVEFAIDNAEELILGFCHVEEIPAGLTTTKFRMAMDIFRNEQPGESSANGTVSSVSIGDTSTSFASDSEYKQSLLKDYEKSLRAYRRMKF